MVLQNILKSKKKIKHGLIFSIVLFVISIPLRKLHIDDPWIAEYSYWIAKLGYLRSDLMQGFLNYSEQMFVYHKGHYLFGALVYKIFGFTMYAFKASSLFWMLASFVLVKAYTRLKPDVFSTQSTVYLVFFMLFINNQFFEYGFALRPEMMMLFFGFSSFLALYKRVNSQSAAAYLTPLAGLLAGLGGFTHLTGLVFSFSGFSFLLIKREFKSSFIFGIFCLIGFAPYFYDITSLADWQGFLYQLKNDPVLATMSGGGFAPLTKLLHEHQRYFVYPWVVSFTLVLFFTLIFDFKKIKSEQKDLLLMTGLSALFLALLTAKTAKYLIIITPYLTLLIAPSLLKINNFKGAKKYVLALSLFLFITVNFGYNLQIISRAEDKPKKNAQIAKLIPHGSYVLSSISFVFNQIDNYNIQAINAHTLWQTRYLKIAPSMDSLLEFATKHQRSYVILDKKFSHKVYTDELNSWDYHTKTTHKNFKIIYHDKQFVVFKRMT